MPASSMSQPRVGLRDFLIDLSSGEVRKSGRKIQLPPKAFKILEALLERPGEVVTREALRARLWPADTFVEFDDSLNHAVQKLRQALGDSTASHPLVETLPRYGYRLITAEAVTTEVRPKLRSLAVLPLANLCGDSRGEYLADGMTDALITELAKVKAVKVISRTSVMQYKSVQKALPQIARELGVEGILEGAVQRIGRRLHVTMQLIDPATDTHLWAESYDRDFGDVLTLQRDIAQAVARQIESELTPAELNRSVSLRSIVPEAYESYLKGKFHWYRLSAAHLDRALRYFQRALELDPDCALAYVGSASVWIMRGDTGFMAPHLAIPKAKAALFKALELDESLSQAHSLLGFIAASYEWNWTMADREFQRALELSPGDGDAHFLYADYLVSMNRIDEWASHMQAVFELDPLNSFFQCFYGWFLVYLHQYDEAIAQLRESLSMDSNYPSAHLGLWGAYFSKGMYREALQEAQKFFAVIGDHRVAQTLRRARSDGDVDYRKVMRAAAAALVESSQSAYVPCVRIARLYAHAGEEAAVLDWLEKACEHRETTLMHLSVARDWDLVRAEARFRALLRRIGLPASQPRGHIQRRSIPSRPAASAS